MGCIWRKTKRVNLGARPGGRDQIWVQETGYEGRSPWARYTKIPLLTGIFLPEILGDKKTILIYILIEKKLQEIVIFW